VNGNKKIVEEVLKQTNVSNYIYNGSKSEFKIDFDSLGEAVDFSNLLTQKGFQGSIYDIFFENGKLTIRCN